MSNVDDLEEQNHQRNRGRQNDQAQQQRQLEEEKSMDQKLYEKKVQYNEGMGGDMPDRIGKFAIRSAALVGVGAVGYAAWRQTKPIQSANNNWFKQWDEMTREGKDPRAGKDGKTDSGLMAGIYGLRSDNLRREDYRGERPESDRGVGVVDRGAKLDTSWAKDSSLNDPRFDGKPMQEAALEVHVNDAPSANRQQAQIMDKSLGEKTGESLGKFGRSVNDFYGIDVDAIDQARAREAARERQAGPRDLGAEMQMP